jgi:hypothetical protein
LVYKLYSPVLRIAPHIITFVFQSGILQKEAFVKRIAGLLVLFLLVGCGGGGGGVGLARIREKIKRLGVTGDDVAAAVRWARRRG